MRAADDHCLGDATKTFCKFCGGADGNLKSYDDVLRGMTGFFTRTQGLDQHVAHETARTMMANQPAWKGR
jgi:hypothetical protein